jgi:beta-galactosidase
LKKTLFSLLSLAVSAPSFAQEWNDQNITEVNKERATEIVIPFDNAENARTKSLEQSPFFFSLNGTWKFHWVKSPGERPVDFYRTAYDVSSWDDIKVPATWQIEAVRNGKSWDKPLYCNFIYPFTGSSVQWPNVIQPRPGNYTFYAMPNPVGSYRREFTLPASWTDRDVFIRFNGVEAGFYLWLNGRYVGYSEDSYLPAEFNLTPYVQAGNNVLAVEVYRFTDGSFLECQDFWRLSGIHRDVFLWSAPKTRIRDFFFRTDLDADYRNATVSLDVELAGQPPANASLNVRILSEDGSTLAETNHAIAETGSSTLTFTVASPLKWTAETPHLHTLLLTLKEGNNITDVRAKKVGFREIELAHNGQILINGKPILFKGVDRHDHSYENGRTVSREEMELDVRLMKSLNINAVRTSHYPNNPYFYDLCDRYGIYVLSEANVECHGETRLSEYPEWIKPFRERNENMVRRYRNHASIAMWSMGNESGSGRVVFEPANRAIKALDATRPTHYEGIKDDVFCDVSSDMYPSLDRLISIGEDRLAKFNAGQAVKPHVVCENVHAMGNAMGNHREYIELYKKYPALAGHFIWEWVDHNIRMPDGKGGYYKAYGGDFNDVPNDGNFCADGLIFADRTWSSKTLDAKKMYQPVDFERVGTGMRFKVFNNRFHAGTSDLTVSWQILENGKAIRSGTVGDLDIAPQSSVEISVDGLPGMLAGGAEYFINFSVRQKEDTPWQPAGYEVASEQIKLAETCRPLYAIENITHVGARPLTVEQDDATVTLRSEYFQAHFSKAQGTLSRYVQNGVDLISEPLKLNLFRAATDNDKEYKDPWIDAGLNSLTVVPGAFHVEENPATHGVDLQIKNIYKGNKGHNFIVEIRFSVLPDGSIFVNSVIDPERRGEILPRVGFRLEMPQPYGRLRWYGRGPGDSYRDRKESAFIGIHESTVAGQWVDFARPQEMGNHEDVRWMSLTRDDDGTGILFVADATMSASALNFRAEDFFEAARPKYAIRHPYQLTPRSASVVCLDAAQRPLGNNSCGQHPLEKYELRAETFVFNFMILPIKEASTGEQLTKKAVMHVDGHFRRDRTIAPERAEAIMDAVYASYSVPETALLRENYPFDAHYRASYLGDGDRQAQPSNPYAYLWPFSGTLSAVTALYEASADEKYREMFYRKVLAGLEEYADTLRKPVAYSSGVASAPASDRFYDDNIWIGIDLADWFLLTGDSACLEKACMIWDFIESGTDTLLGGGIYWCEQKKRSKNACSNAPAAVLALKLFDATRDSLYFYRGKHLYEWTRQHLQDPNDGLYYDNIRLNGKIDKTKYSYNSGQMLQAAASLYRLSGDASYLQDAQRTASASYDYFFEDFQPDSGEKFRLVKPGNVWFTAILFRGFCELYRADRDRRYIEAFERNLDYAWNHARDDSQLFGTDWSGRTKNALKWLLTQTAMVEMYARLEIIKKNK